MLAILQGLGALGAWAAGLVAAKWGYKIALVAAVLAVYVAVWAAMLAAISVLVAAIPSSPLPAFTVQFFPSRGAVAAAVSMYFGTMATMRSLDYWRLATGLAARIGL